MITYIISEDVQMNTMVFSKQRTDHRIGLINDQWLSMPYKLFNLVVNSIVRIVNFKHLKIIWHD